MERLGNVGKYGVTSIEVLEKGTLGYLIGFLMMVKYILAVVRIFLGWERIKSKEREKEVCSLGMNLLVRDNLRIGIGFRLVRSKDLIYWGFSLVSL